MFLISRRRKLITKGNKLGSIIKDTDNKAGYGVSVDQLQSDQPELVPQFSGKLTSARIWSVKLMVNHFSDLTYVNLIGSTIQEDSLVVKFSFQTWAATFLVKIKDIMQTMEYFLNNLSDQKLRMPTIL